MSFLVWISGSHDPVAWPVRIIFTVLAYVLLFNAKSGKR